MILFRPSMFRAAIFGARLFGRHVEVDKPTAAFDGFISCIVQTVVFVNKRAN